VSIAMKITNHDIEKVQQICSVIGWIHSII
jgi:hypothetical protein